MTNEEFTKKMENFTNSLKRLRDNLVHENSPINNEWHFLIGILIELIESLLEANKYENF